MPTIILLPNLTSIDYFLTQLQSQREVFSLTCTVVEAYHILPLVEGGILFVNNFMQT